jgi:pyruvate/2-oxoglutarate dehydrogenase complex dihydrolipoamide dehydrogenase (E3) component
MVEELSGKSDLMEKNNGSHVYDMLFDKLNCDMYDNVRPTHWVDPKIDGDFKYDLLVIDGGAAAMVSAAGASSLGAKTCMIEKGFFGGDCLVTGCVPSKAFLRAANVVHAVNNSSDFGVKIKGTVEVDFPALMDRMKRIRADISHHDAIKNFTHKYGVDVFLGHG